MTLSHSTAASTARLVTPDEREFADFYAIYQDSISITEQKPQSTLVQMLRSPDYRFYALSINSQLTGFSIFYVSQTEGFALLEYMAVKSDERSRGMGSKLFSKSVGLLSEEFGKIPVVLEVDSDREQALDHATRVRRIKFYTDLGCQRIEGFEYAMPEVGNGVPPRMDLYFYNYGAKHQVIEPSDVARWVSKIYAGVYHRPPHDPMLGHMLAQLRQK